MNYYLKVQDRAYGPFTTEKIRSMIQRGNINAESLVSTDKQNWREVAAFPELLGETQTSQASASAPSAPAAASNGSPAATAPTATAPTWFISFDGATGYGPYPSEEIAAFVRDGRANANSLVWRNGENARPIASEPEFSRLFTQSAPNANSFVNSASVSPTVQKLNARYRYYWLCIVLAIVLPLAGVLFDFISALVADLSTPIFTAGGLILACVALIVASVSFFSFIYAFWKTLPADYAPTTPGRAVGFLFIPYFVFYWNFIVFYEGARAANRALTDFTPKTLQRTQISEGLGLVYAITCIVCQPVAFIVTFPLLNQMRNAGRELSRLN